MESSLDIEVVDDRNNQGIADSTSDSRSRGRAVDQINLAVGAYDGKLVR